MLRQGSPWRRSRPLAAVAACLVVLLSVGGWLVWSVLQQDSRVTGGTPTTAATTPATGATVPTTPAPPTTTSAVACSPSGATDRQHGTGQLSNPPNSTVLINVQVQASDCVDEVGFSFSGGTPDWTAEYQAGPFSDSPRGERVAVEGNAFLVVQFSHAAGTPELTPGMTSPGRDLHPGSPSGVLEVVRTQDFEGELTWIIGLDARRPFQLIEPTQGQLVVRLPAARSRPMSCTSDPGHFRIDVPNGAFVELSDDFRCRVFGTQPFLVIRNSDAPVPISVSPGQPWDWSSPPGQTSVARISTRSTTIDGRATTVLEGEYNGVGFSPAGTRFYLYEIQWGPGLVLHIDTIGKPGAEHDANKLAVDAIAASARYVP